LITEALAATVENPATTPVVGDVVNFTLTPLTANGCGTLASPSVTTVSGGIAADTYTEPFVLGFCTVTATEAAAQPGESAPQSGTAVQDTTSTTTPVPTTVTTTNTTANVAEGGTATVTETVTGASSALVANDPVLLIPTGSDCGTFNTTSGTTNASGVVTFTYTAPSATGTCSISAIEAQATKTATAPEVITTTANNSVAAVATPSTVAPAGTSTVTATVKTFGGAAVAGDTVGFVGTPSVTGACGTFTPAAAGLTNASGVFTATYTASAVAGFCTIVATETGTGQTGNVVITQS
jgi:hypothetical protein